MVWNHLNFLSLFQVWDRILLNEQIWPNKSLATLPCGLMLSNWVFFERCVYLTTWLVFLRHYVFFYIHNSVRQKGRKAITDGLWEWSMDDGRERKQLKVWQEIGRKYSWWKSETVQIFFFQISVTRVRVCVRARVMRIAFCMCDSGR